jgi:hypothetical protein
MPAYVLCTLSRNDRLLTRCDVGQVISIDMLPDHVLLEIFEIYVDRVYDDEDVDEKKEVEAWQPLVHVCHCWRSVVFGSPRRLDLQLACTANTLARDTVDIWPALPLVICDFGCKTGSVGNIIALLERSDLVRRITQINLCHVSSSQLDDISEAMQVPFPELTHLELRNYDETEPVLLPLSDSFVGGSAPRLRFLWLDRIPYPGLPKLLLSATHLISLYLHHSGYISPEAMVACLSTMTGLEALSLGFGSCESPRRRSDWESRRSPSLTRILLPVLDRFWFKGVGEYLEHLVARIDAPRLESLDITFFNDIVFVTPQFTRFISHTQTLEAFDRARVDLWDDTASIELSSGYARLIMRISCRELDWQLSFLEQVCTSSLPPVSTLEDLYMSGRPWPQDWKDTIDYAQWLELLHSFTAVKNLYLSKELAPCVVPALQDLVGGRTTEVFPNLQNIFLKELQESGPVQEGIGKFFATRQVTGHRSPNSSFSLGPGHRLR